MTNLWYWRMVSAAIKTTSLLKMKLKSRSLARVISGIDRFSNGVFLGKQIRRQLNPLRHLYRKQILPQGSVFTPSQQ